MAQSHLPVLPNDHSIRVISLAQPDQPDDPLKGSIQVIDLNEPGHTEYMCLSYTWGEPTPEAGPHYSISIGGATHSIRQNPSNALYRLREHIGSRPVWIDALSIAQDDLEEKGQQVAMIAKIFSSATEVFAWIGEHADDSDRILMAEDDEDPIKADLAGRLGHFDRKSPGPVERHAWRKLCERPYWTRTWIIQEVVSSRCLALLCGPTALSWDWFLRLLCLQEKRLWDRSIKLSPIDGGVRINRLASFKRDRHIGQFKGSFFDAMFLATNSHCSDDRDRVYAILSLDDKYRLKEQIQPDYSLSILDLFDQCMGAIRMLSTVEANIFESFVRTALRLEIDGV